MATSARAAGANATSAMKKRHTQTLKRHARIPVPFAHIYLNPETREKLQRRGTELSMRNLYERTGRDGTVTIKRRAPAKKICRAREKLETDVWAEGDAQIVMRAACEIDFIAEVQAQADRTDVSFKAAAGTENAGKIIRAQIFNGTYRGSDSGGAIVEKEVMEAAF